MIKIKKPFEFIVYFQTAFKIFLFIFTSTTEGSTNIRLAQRIPKYYLDLAAVFLVAFFSLVAVSTNFTFE